MSIPNIQTILHAVEVGKARAVVYLIPLFVTFFVICGIYNFRIYHGLNDAQSMDNAQLARQIAQGSGFTTKFLRPYAIAQLHAHAAAKGNDLFPSNLFPPGAPRILPDTYNAPGYPYLLAGWFRLVHPQFDQSVQEMASRHMYSGDFWIPWLNQILIMLTAILVFGMGRFLFDHRVAWVAALAFLCSDMIWKYSITALSTGVLMFLVTALLFALGKIFCVAEAHFESDEPFWPAWIWAIIVGLLLAATGLTRLNLLALLLPVLIFLGLMPRTPLLLLPLVAIVVIGLVAPWFWHTYQISGNPLGSNTPLLLYGQKDYTGNQIYCQSAIPPYEQPLRDIGSKEIRGFRWHFEHAWELLGANPMILLFAACSLHRFKRGRANAIFWLIVGSAFSIIAANNLGATFPAAIDSWNTLAVLFPGMLVMGSAFFFILLDRLNLQLWVLNNLVMIVVLILTAMPLALSLAASTNTYYNYPPYIPPIISQVANLAKPDEWVTSDMPWATAWYGNRASLWLPDSIENFEQLYDETCPTGMLLLTSVTQDESLLDLTTGEHRDWFHLLSNAKTPEHFPLYAHTAFPPGGPNYIMFSNTDRWK